jgi:hypothetical protein
MFSVQLPYTCHQDFVHLVKVISLFHMSRNLQELLLISGSAGIRSQVSGITACFSFRHAMLY